MTYPSPRFLVYAPNSDAVIGEISSPENVKFHGDYTKTSSLSFSLPDGGHPLLAQPCEIEVEVPSASGDYVKHARYNYLDDDSDLVSTDGSVSYTCPDMWWRLSGAIVLQEDDPTWMDGGPKPGVRYKRRFSNHTALQVMQTLISEEQSRGRLVGVSVTGVPDMIPDFLEFETGTTLDKVLSTLIGRRLCLARWSGRELNIIPINAGSDLSAVTNIVAGRDIVEAPYKRTYENQVDSVYVIGSNNLDSVTTAGGSDSPWGSRIASVNAGGANTIERLVEVGNRHLATVAQVQREQTARIALDGASRYPLSDYNIGDTIGIWSPVPGQNNGAVSYRKERVTQIQVQSSNGQYVANLVLGHKITDGDLAKLSDLESKLSDASSKLADPPRGVDIDDFGVSPDTTWSSDRIDDMLDGMIDDFGISPDTTWSSDKLDDMFGSLTPRAGTPSEVVGRSYCVRRRNISDPIIHNFGGIHHALLPYAAVEFDYRMGHMYRFVVQAPVFHTLLHRNGRSEVKINWMVFSGPAVDGQSVTNFLSDPLKSGYTVFSEVKFLELPTTPDANTTHTEITQVDLFTQGKLLYVGDGQRVRVVLCMGLSTTRNIGPGATQPDTISTDLDGTNEFWAIDYGPVAGLVPLTELTF